MSVWWKQFFHWDFLFPGFSMFCMSICQALSRREALFWPAHATAHMLYKVHKDVSENRIKFFKSESWKITTNRNCQNIFLWNLQLPGHLSLFRNSCQWEQEAFGTGQALSQLDSQASSMFRMLRLLRVFWRLCSPEEGGLAGRGGRSLGQGSKLPPWTEHHSLSRDPVWCAALLKWETEQAAIPLSCCLCRGFRHSNDKCDSR